MFKRTSLAIVALGLISTTSALAAEGRTPIFASGTVITAPGKYFVSQNLPTNLGGPIIDIQATEVDIDLNGMVLDQSANLSSPAIQSLGGATTHVAIRNGTVIGGSSTISLNGVRKVIVVDGQSAGNRIFENLVTQTVGVGISVNQVGGQIEGNIMISNSSWGLLLGASTVPLSSNSNIYARNTARLNAGSGRCIVALLPDFCDLGIGNTTAGNNFLPTLF